MNNSIWRSTGVAGQQAVCDMVTHTGSGFYMKIRFLTNVSSMFAFIVNVDRFGALGNLREWNLIVINNALEFYLFGTNNGVATEARIANISTNGNFNNGQWHELEVNWVSNGVGLGGLFTYIWDGVTKTQVTILDTINLTALPLTLNGRVTGGSPDYPCPFDMDYLEINDARFNFSNCWGDRIYSTDGSQFFQLQNCVYSDVWVKDDDATPHNFRNGFYLYENGVAGEEIRHPIQLESGDIPSGYSLSGYYPPLVFGNMESTFKVPYNALVAVADTEGKLYTGTTPKAISFSDLVAGGFGLKIKYVGTVAEGFRKFCVKK